MKPHEICALAAHGNPDAERFCLAWVRFSHTLDDIEDRDHPVTDTDLAEMFVQFLQDTLNNRFVNQNHGALVGLMTQAANAWLDSNRLPGGVERDVLKGFWHEVVFHVAYLTGGFKHLRHVSQACREYGFEQKEVTNGPV
jgi:hypothetical protein